MANGMILRGEVYWVSVDDSVGGEIQTGRPAVIISGDRANEKCSTVIVAFITSQGNFHPHNVTIMVNGVSNRVKCDQLRTISKDRLTRYMGTLTKPEIVRITGALATAMCIPLRGPESTPQEKENKEITALKAECEMWKRCYDVVMSQLVELKVNTDLTLRMARAGYEYEESDESEEIAVEEPPVAEESEVEELEPPKEPEVVVEQEAPVEEPVTPAVEQRVVEGDESTIVLPPLDKVNINTATAREMMNHLGIGQYYAYKINAHRNKNGKFVALEELEMVEGLPKDFYEKYADRCTIGESEVTEKPLVVEQPEVPVEVQEPNVVDGKVNVNTASAKELSEALGLSLNVCYAITGKRKREGLFTSLEQIIVPKRFTEGMLEIYRDKLTVAEPQQEEPKSDKVNINTASLRDLMAIGFEKRAAALIVNERRKCGRFRDVDDLAEIPEISGKILRKLRDKLEV